MPTNFHFDFNDFERFPFMCLIVSDTGEILNLNSTAKKVLGYSEEDIINESFFNLIETPYTEKIKEILDSRSHHENKSKNIFVKMKSKNGIHKIELMVMPFINDQKKYFFLFPRDITKENNEEINLRRFSLIADKTMNPIQITDLNGKMIYVNPAFINISGYSEDELIGKNPSVFGSGKHSKKFWEKMWETITSGNVWVGEIEDKKKNGEPFYTQVLISPITDDDKNITGFFGIHHDIGEKKLLEKNLIHSQKMESIGMLAAGVAHEVGNPLASISALVQVVQRTTKDEFAKEKLELVKSQVTRISKTIRDLVDFSRPSNYELSLTDINKNIYEAVEIIKAGIKTKDIKFNLNLNSNLPKLFLIEDQIQQVFVNILINAVDALTEDDKNKNKRISIISDSIDDNIRITIEDTGPGISEENISKVFEPFFTTKKEGKGTGLGLWITYGITKSFQGDINLESSKGKGTKFIITLPTSK